MNKYLIKLKQFLFSEENYKPLKIIYIIAIAVYVVVFFLGPDQTHDDTWSFYAAMEKLFSGEGFDHFRTPVYPFFLKITYHWLIAAFIQFGMFLISISVFYAILKMLTKSSRLIFLIMLIYVMYPAFTVYHRQLITESFSISFGVIMIFSLIKLMKYKKIKYIWMFHLILLFLIFLKPAFVFYIAASFLLFIYLLFTEKRKKILVHYLLSSLLVVSLVFGYSSIMNKKYGAPGLSSVTDVNLYWMLRQYDLVDLDSIENENLKNALIETFKYSRNYPREAFAIIEQYGWNELHSITQNSLKKNYKEFLFGEKSIHKKLQEMDDPVGLRPGDKFADQGMVFSFNTYHLFMMLAFYVLLILSSWIKRKKMPALSILFLAIVMLNIITFMLTAPDSFGRLIIPSLPVVLILFMQCSDFLFHFLNKKENEFYLN